MVAGPELIRGSKDSQLKGGGGDCWETFSACRGSGDVGFRVFQLGLGSRRKEWGLRLKTRVSAKHDGPLSPKP